MDIILGYLAGLLTLINPCVLPVLPIVLVSALNADRLGPVALAAGMSASFVAFGVLVTAFGPAIGLPELGLWAILLATTFLMVGWFAKTLIAALVFLVDPEWLSGTADLQWPEPSFRNLVAIAILALLASRPHARMRHRTGDDD